MLPRKSSLTVLLFLYVIASLILSACGAGQQLAELREWYKGIHGLEITWSSIYAQMEVDYSAQLQTIMDKNPLADKCFLKSGEALDVTMRGLVEGNFDAPKGDQSAATTGGFDIKALGLNGLNPVDMKACQQILLDISTDISRLRANFADNQKLSITYRAQFDNAIQADVVKKVLLDMIRKSPTDQQLDEFKIPSMSLHVELASKPLCDKLKTKLETNGELYGVPYNYGNKSFNPVEWDEDLNRCNLYGIAAYKYMSRLVISSAASKVFTSGEEQGIPGLSATETPK